MLGTQYSGKMVGQMKSKNRVLKISPLPQQGIPPPTGLGSLGGVRRGTARTRGAFFEYRPSFSFDPVLQWTRFDSQNTSHSFLHYPNWNPWVWRISMIGFRGDSEN